jgi:hypothetical protein
MIYIRCPLTLREIATGIDTDPFSFLSLPDVSTKMSCCACGNHHAWRRSEAWLAPETELEAGQLHPAVSFAVPRQPPLDEPAGH